MRILIIEDNVELALATKEGLNNKGLLVDITHNGIDGKEMAFVNEYDAILLDLNLPDIDGLQVLAEMRGMEIKTPIIIITARTDLDQRIKGLDLGADDYISKPFQLTELRARIHAVIRRSHGRVSNDIIIGSLTIKPKERKAYYQKSEIALKSKEFDILEYLGTKHPEVVSSEAIAEHIYDDSYNPFSSVLRVHLARLKKALHQAQGSELLVTTRGKRIFIMRKINLKTSGIILLFSLAVTTIFVIMVLTLSNHFSEQVNFTTASYHGIAIVDNSQIQEIINNGAVSITTDNLFSINNLSGAYEQNLTTTLIPFALGFCLFLFIAVFILSILLNRVRNQENKQLIDSLGNLLEGLERNNTDPSFMEIYNKLESKFENNLNDFKRLNSYLSHEQKNSIALLKTQMEVRNDENYINQIDYLANSIDDVLTLSDNEPSNEIVDVVVTCAQIYDLYKESYPQLSIEFTDDDTFIAGKERWIFRAISNLVDNAIKYGNNNPINITIDNIKDSITIKIRDFGQGIAESQLDYIFDNKYRINELNTDGYGIGLSLVSHVCDLCDGIVWVDSTLGEGSTFYLSFPAIVNIG